MYILREKDLYFLFKTGGIGVNGRGSHGHNDSLSIEVSACGMPFIVDPGTYVYTADLHQRHLFRSTSYHSTVQVDGVEQNATEEAMPFVIGNEAHPQVLRWESGPDQDLLSAQHHGYQHLSQPVTHRRTVIFHKRERLWMLEDELDGSGRHEFVTRFHFNSGLDVRAHRESGVVVRDQASNARLFVLSLNVISQPKLEEQFTSRDYGAKEPSISACWTVATAAPDKTSWAIIPVCANDDEEQRLNLVTSFRNS